LQLDNLISNSKNGKREYLFQDELLEGIFNEKKKKSSSALVVRNTIYNNFLKIIF
jgi:hypothetical protein